MVNRIMGSSYTAEDFGFPVSQQPEAQVHNGALPAIKRTKETIMATSPKKGPNSACAVAPEHPRPACRHAAAASRSCWCADTLLWWRVQCTIRLQGPSNSKKRPTCSRQPLSLQQAVFAEMSSSAKAITHVLPQRAEDNVLRRVARLQVSGRSWTGASREESVNRVCERTGKDERERLGKTMGSPFFAFAHGFTAFSVKSYASLVCFIISNDAFLSTALQ